MALLALVGCTTRSKADAKARAAFRAGHVLAQPEQPAVFFRGEIRNLTIPWTDGLTLAQAIVGAEYVGRRDPILIVIARRGAIIRVNPRQLLRGTDDPLLEPGDLVEIR